jgi:fatty-acyl-CoA synthase
VEHTVWRLFDAVAAEIPDRPAIVSSAGRMTYGALAERASRLANVLIGAGLGVRTPRTELEPWEIGQDTVGVYLLNGPEYLEVMLGGYAACTAPFNINYRYVADELVYLLDDAGATALVYHGRYAPTVREVLDRLDRRPRLLLQVADGSGEPLLPGALDYEAALAAASADIPALDADPDDIHLLYTGGTTGMPKGTMWRQGDIWAASLRRDEFDDDADLDTIAASARGRRFTMMPTAPFMHGAALWLGLSGLLLGQTIVINDIVDHLDPVDFWTTLERERANGAVFIGEAVARPLIQEVEAGTYDASSLQLLVIGGAPTTPDTKERILRALPHVMLVDLAGASETGSALSQVSVAGGPRPEAAVFDRRPYVGVMDESRSRLLDPGHEGTGWFAKSGHVPLGYLGDREKTMATFPTIDGVRWAVPGDRARLRADGRVELLGRDSVTINSGGEKVFAEEVERAMLSHAGVADVMVVGRASERWGQEVVAIVELEPGHAPPDDELVEAAGAHVARYKLPKAIVRVPRIERSPSGKADYRWARDTAEAAAGGASRNAVASEAAAARVGLSSRRPSASR